METTKKTYRLGEYYLTQNRQGKWCRTWYDETIRQRRATSLGTDDFQQAKKELDRWFIENNSPRKDTNLELARCLLEYWEQHAQYLKRHKVEQDHMKFWLEHFPLKPVKDIRPLDQRKFIKSLVDRGYSKSFIVGIFKTGAAAIRFAWKNDMMPAPLPLVSPAKELEKYKFKTTPRYRALELEEVATLIDNVTVDRLIRFILIMVGCACRPAAAIELSGSQIDLIAGTISLLKPGEEQSNKYRPVVRLPSFIRLIYHEQYLCFQGPARISEDRQMDSLRRAWNGAKRRGKLDSLVVPYSIRHTMAKWLRQQGVQAWHTSAQMGHKRQGSEITELYAPNDPAYLDEALNAIENYFEMLHHKSPGLQKFVARIGDDATS